MAGPARGGVTEGVPFAGPGPPRAWGDRDRAGGARAGSAACENAPMPLDATLPRLCLVIAALLSAACSRKPSDEEQIRSLFTETARAAEERRVGDVMRGVSDRFEGQGLDKQGVKQLVAFHVLRGSWVALALGGEKLSVAGDAASAAVDVVMIRSGKGRVLAELLPEQATVHRFTFRLEREADGWKVTSATWRPVPLEEAAAGPDDPPPPR